MGDLKTLVSRANDDVHLQNPLSLVTNSRLKQLYPFQQGAAARGAAARWLAACLWHEQLGPAQQRKQYFLLAGAIAPCHV